MYIYSHIFKKTFYLMYCFSGAQQIDTGSGLINDVYTENLLTLRGNQTIPGHIIFNQLEVTESIDGNATVIGFNIDEVQPNPSLHDTNVIDASCRFNNLIVNGNLIVKDTLNGIDLDTTFEDIIYDTDDEALVTGFKEFEDVEFVNELTVTSGLINDRHIDKFITTDTDQVLNISHITGSIFFHDLKLSGYYDSINVTNLYLNTIKINGDQYTDAILDFDVDGEYDFYVNELYIENTINGESVDKIIANRHSVYRGNYEIDDLMVDHLEVSFLLII